MVLGTLLFIDLFLDIYGYTVLRGFIDIQKVKGTLCRCALGKRIKFVPERQQSHVFAGALWNGD